MLGLLNRTDELDWRQDPDYIAAVTVANTAKVTADQAEAAHVAAWRKDNIQGTAPAPDSPYWDAKRAMNVAAQAFADAAGVRDRAEAVAKAAVRPAWIDGYRDRASRIFAIEDQLIDALIELDQWRDGAEGQGFTGLPWVAPGQMSIADLRQNQAARRLLVEQI